jgi:hypothetical protein
MCDSLSILKPSLALKQLFLCLTRFRDIVANSDHRDVSVIVLKDFAGARQKTNRAICATNPLLIGKWLSRLQNRGHGC